MHLFYVRFS